MTKTLLELFEYDLKPAMLYFALFPYFYDSSMVSFKEFHHRWIEEKKKNNKKESEVRE